MVARQLASLRSRWKHLSLVKSARIAHPSWPHVLRAPVAATPSGLRTDSPPHLPTRASHAPVRPRPHGDYRWRQTARVLATQTAIPVPTSEIPGWCATLPHRQRHLSLSRHPFASFGTDSPPIFPARFACARRGTPSRLRDGQPTHLPTRASHAPVATTVPTATTDGAKPARILRHRRRFPCDE